MTDVVVLTTAMLTFISFWRAAAIVLCDMASTAWYIGGIVEKAIGPAAPWYIAVVMLFSAPVLSLYVEASSMFVRGGVYKVVRESMGGTMAKLSVSALMFDYVLTGAISSVSAGQYLAGLVNSAFPYLHINWQVDPKVFSVVFGVVVVLYFWRQNIRGIEESSDKALKIMSLVTVMGVLLFAWSAYTISRNGFHWPSFELRFSEESLGWWHGESWSGVVGRLGVLIALGHAFLGMSGLETLAQVYREMEAPKLANLKRAAVIIFVFAIALTATMSFLAVGIIPHELRAQYSDNLLSGLAMSLAGPHWALLAVQAFVVVVGVLILSGAVNTSIMGSNGVLNRLAEDGIMPDWLRWLHPRFGTTHRMIHLVVVLQCVTIVLCRGDVYLLGEAYAFGVIWSFVFKSAAITVLRFKQPGAREWKVPFNLVVGRREWPLGLMAIFACLLTFALINLFTKSIATVSGVLFTLAFFALFTLSEKLNARHARKSARGEHREKLNLRDADDLTGVLSELDKENRVLVAVRDPNGLMPLQKALETHDPDKTDIVVFHTKILKGLGIGADADVSLGPDEELLFTRVIAMAEKHGKTVTPMLVISNEPFYAIVQAAHVVGASEVIMGVTQRVNVEVQLERMAMNWGALAGAGAKPVRFKLVGPGKDLTMEL